METNSRTIRSLCLALRAFGTVRVPKARKSILRLTASTNFGATWNPYRPSGFGALERAPHPHCARPQTLRVCLLGLAQRFILAPVRRHIVLRGHPSSPPSMAGCMIQKSLYDNGEYSYTITTWMKRFEEGNKSINEYFNEIKL